MPKFIQKCLLIIVSLGAFACTEIIDMGYTTEDEKLVVDASVMDLDTVQYVKLTKININPGKDGIVSPISKALVMVNNVVFNETADSAGLYIAPEGFKGENGINYKLTIENTGLFGDNGEDLYTSEVIMPNKTIIDSVGMRYVIRPQMGQIGYELLCWAWDGPERNYYLFKAWRNGVLLTDSIFEYDTSDDYVYNGSYINGASCQFYSDFKTDEYILQGDTVMLEINNIDKGFYDFVNTAKDVYWGTNPMFGGPPANAISNVSNGALGVFRVYSPAYKSTIVEVDERPYGN